MLNSIACKLMGSARAPTSIEADDAGQVNQFLNSPCSGQEVLGQIDILNVIFSSSIFSPEEALSLASVSTTFQSALTSPMLWGALVSPELKRAAALGPDNIDSDEQAGLGHLGPRKLTLPKLYMAFFHFNLLRNPSFRLSDNTSTTSTSLHPWKRLAWVIKSSGGNGVSWETTGAGVCSDALPPVKPYFKGRMKSLSNKWRMIDESTVKWVQEKLRQGLQIGTSTTAAASSQSQTPLSSGPSPAAAAIHSCIATSFQFSEIVQVVDFVEELEKRGLSRHQAEHILDCGLSLGFSIQIGTRFDQGNEFSIVLALLGANPSDPLRSAEVHIPSPSTLHFNSGRFLNMKGSEWQRFAHTLDVPKGCRSAVILLSGRDRDFWAGNYGAKFTNAELVFVGAADKDGFVGRDGVENWKARGGS